ncbi:MAG: hypothetical protein L0287_35815 [Anaerolineae bacterium]|nr:hypothetical protein [Anaerolineae bacterium]MCI0610549.1 hypothetical protein [Anaerolineae bacterium]
MNLYVAFLRGINGVFLHKKSGKKSEKALMSLRSDAGDFAVKGREVYNLRRDRDKSVSLPRRAI